MPFTYQILYTVAVRNSFLGMIEAWVRMMNILSRYKYEPRQIVQTGTISRSLHLRASMQTRRHDAGSKRQNAQHHEFYDLLSLQNMLLSLLLTDGLWTQVIGSLV